MGDLMTERLIYKFNIAHKPYCHQMLALVDNMGADYWQNLGYDRDENGIIPKIGGVNAEGAQHVGTWDSVTESPDGQYCYFTSLTNDERFKNGTIQLQEAGFPFEEVELPAEWLPVREEDDDVSE